VTFNKSEGYQDRQLELPCGQCIGCRLDRSREWAVRMEHEAQMHDENCFLTLTYDNEHLPEDLSLDVRHFQGFMKRFRRHVEPRKLRFYHCGEYGDNLGRPHYHSIIFGYDFPDKVYYKSVNGERYYVSEYLNGLWGHGYCVIGDVTFESAAYCARYVTKKVNGYAADFHYCRIDPQSGEWVWRKPEYSTMSRRPGLGADWIDAFRTDVWNGQSDSVVCRGGMRVKPPRFYYDRLKDDDAREARRVKGSRIVGAKRHADNNTPDRLKVREKVKEAQFNQLVRGLENETRTLHGL
jgi:hypothetical protein